MKLPSLSSASRALPAARSPWRPLGAATLALALMGAAVAQAQPALPPVGPGAMHGGHHRMGPGMPDGPMMIERALDAVGTSAEQKAKVHEIFKAARGDQLKQREEGRALHQQMMALLAAPQIDAAAAESLRQQQVARHDAASKRWLQATLDAIAVLTPEQRQKLAERLKSRREMMERHQRERRSMEAPRG